ncbi:response regulator [Sutcliffiella halmapala]|uniref:response regulator n=1 Tax=Sutcliffiella halmapala TaxID=79882 RepID=UPI0009951A08|nr:response regulator transcription factor [Sutcliffiella halmapala]
MIRIVVAEDQELLLGAIGSLLNLEEDMEVVGLASNGEEALRLVQELEPDICIMDIEMPKKSGLEAAEALKESGCKVMILTTFARTGYFQRALNAGVQGYLLKDTPSEDLVWAVHRIMDGEEMYAPDLMDEDSIDTERDVEILDFLNDGTSNNDLSNPQRKTMGSVRKYFSTIMDNMKLPTG